MKKTNLFLVQALVALSLVFVVSCKPDNDDGNGNNSGGETTTVNQDSLNCANYFHPDTTSNYVNGKCVKTPNVITPIKRDTTLNIRFPESASFDHEDINFNRISSVRNNPEIGNISLAFVSSIQGQQTNGRLARLLPTVDSIFALPNVSMHPDLNTAMLSDFTIADSNKNNYLARNIKLIQN